MDHLGKVQVDTQLSIFLESVYQRVLFALEKGLERGSCRASPREMLHH